MRFAQIQAGMNIDGGRRVVTEAEIVALTRPLTTHPWADDDLVLLQMADEIYTDSCVTDATWAKLAERWSPKEILEFVNGHRLRSGCT